MRHLVLLSDLRDRLVWLTTLGVPSHYIGVRLLLFRVAVLQQRTVSLISL